MGLESRQVADADLPILRQQDVVGLQVPMDTAVAVHVLKPLQDLEDQAARRLLWHPPLIMSSTEAPQGPAPAIPDQPET